MKLKVENLQIQDYKFHGIVDLGNLSAAVRGSFTVEWNGEYPIVSVEEVTVSGLHHYNLIDFQDLAVQILDLDTGVWWADRMNQMVESAGVV